MKISILVVCLLTVSGAGASMYDNGEFRFKGDTHFAGFCKAVLLDDVKLLKQQLRTKVGKIAGSKEGVMRVVTSEYGVQCDGVDLITFSKQRKATSVLAYFDSTH